MAIEYGIYDKHSSADFVILKVEMICKEKEAIQMIQAIFII